MDPVQALMQAGGAARWTALIAAGVSRRALAGAVASGRVVRRLLGTYALPEAPEAVWLAAAFHAQLTCVSLCAAKGLPLVRRPSTVHLLVPAERGLSPFDTRPTRRVTLHRSNSALAAADANPVAAAIDLASQCVDRYGQIALVDAALRSRAMRPGEIRLFSQADPERRQWLIDHSDEEAQSLMETFARVTLTEAGFSVRPQVVVGPRGHRDLLVEGVVVVELDGWETHGKKDRFIDDRRLDRLTIHAGKVPLRYTYDDLFGPAPADIVADVEAALRLWRASA